MADSPKKTWAVQSNVSDDRDGIGIELLIDGEIVLEIFRDDTKRTRVLTLYSESVSLDLLEESIGVFKEKIPWDFLD